MNSRDVSFVTQGLHACPRAGSEKRCFNIFWVWVFRSLLYQSNHWTNGVVSPVPPLCLVFTASTLVILFFIPYACQSCLRFLVKKLPIISKKELFLLLEFSIISLVCTWILTINVGSLLVTSMNRKKNLWTCFAHLHCNHSLVLKIILFCSMTMIPTFTSLIIIYLIQLSYVSFILYHRQVIFWLL